MNSVLDAYFLFLEVLSVAACNNFECVNLIDGECGEIDGECIGVNASD